MNFIISGEKEYILQDLKSFYIWKIYEFNGIKLIKL